MISFSAKDLLTRSCMQIKMFAEHPEKKPQPSSMVMYGEKFQKAVANTIQNIVGEEMRGMYYDRATDISINFSNDIVCKAYHGSKTVDRIIEVKSVSNPTPDWYLKSSLLQCAFYKSLILMGATHLETATFYVNMGNKRISINVYPSTLEYVLVFGEEKYMIDAHYPDKIVGFFINKAIASLTWEDAKIWDSQYKHMEFDYLADSFGYYNIF